MNTLHGHILTPDGFIHGQIAWEADGRIAAIIGVPVAPSIVMQGPESLMLPGFIDLHVHGGGGYDFMDAGAAATHVARAHAKHGTTSLLATTVTATMEDSSKAFHALSTSCKARDVGAARIFGVHLEGPYINDQRLGAQPAFARKASWAEIQHLHSIAPIKLLTLAPEVEGNLAFISDLLALGMRVQLGHSNGTYEHGVAALQCGASGFTHLFNAMSGLRHREPGMVGAALAHATYAEVIPDFHHVHAGAIRAALRAIPRLYCVTDSTSATDMQDGAYFLGTHQVFKCMGAVRLADGTLAGSTLSMDQALRNLVFTLGLDVADAANRVSTFAADHLGLSDRGRLAVGAWADVVVLSNALEVKAVVVEGERL